MQRFASVLYFSTVDKAELRKKYIEKRKALSTADIERYSAAILEHFKTFDFSGIQLLHIFYPIAGKHEVNSLVLAAWLLKAHPQIKLILPKSDLQNYTLNHIVWKEDTSLAINEWGITEPEDGEAVQPEQIDMVVMPLLVYDAKGNRIGYGKGFYDRFLSECRDDVIKMGVSFFEPEQEFEEAGEFDIPLDVCVTPERVWRF